MTSMENADVLNGLFILEQSYLKVNDWDPNNQ